MKSETTNKRNHKCEITQLKMCDESMSDIVVRIARELIDDMSNIHTRLQHFALLLNEEKLQRCLAHNEWISVLL